MGRDFSISMGSSRLSSCLQNAIGMLKQNLASGFLFSGTGPLVPETTTTKIEYD